LTTVADAAARSTRFVLRRSPLGVVNDAKRTH
jgi:hypothetical protein